MKLILLFLIIIHYLLTNTYGYKILGIFPTMAKSHFIVGSALMKGLAEKGHEVTMLSAFPQKTPIKNYRDIAATDVIQATEFLLANLTSARNDGMITGFSKLSQMGNLITNTTLNDPEVQKFLKSKNETFDLVILEVFLNEAMLGFGAHFNAPIIGVSTFGASAWTNEMVGSPSPPSYVPSPFLGFTDHMTLLQRLGNLISLTIDKIITEIMFLPLQEKLYNLYFQDPKPNFYDIRKNVSLVLLNSHFSLSFPRPYVPNMIEVGGIQVNRKSKPLPANIKNFIESAKDGCIYFSMGSNLKSKILPKEKLEIIINTFKSLKQKVLWKFEDTVLPNKPDNVFISDWFPQDDILAHPNIKIFITHGGLLSTTESIYHGVPIIGIPMFADQFLNMAGAESIGFGLQLDYETLNVDEFKSKILEILKNPIYKNKMKEVSMRYRDQPMSPLDTAIYWVEYVARHKGAPHLHSAGQDLSFIEYHNIDAWLIIISVLILIIYLVVFIIKKVIKFFSKHSNTDKTKKISRKKNQ